MAKRKLRRQWSDVEKRRICGQSQADGASVSEVARRNDVSVYLLRRWLGDPRFAPATDPSCEFLPVEVKARVAELPPVRLEIPEDAPCRLAASDQIEITVPNGCTVRARGAYDPDVLARLVRNLSA